MKRAASLMIVLALATVIWMSVSPVGANGSFQSAGTPTPTPTKVPVKQPVLQPPSNSAPVLRSTIAITRTEAGTPSLTIVSDNLPPTSSVTVTMRTLRFPGPSSSSPTTLVPSRPKAPSAPGDFVDNWELLVNDNFEGTFPITSTCAVWDFSTDGFDRKWGKDSVRATSPTHSIWPARDGANGVNSATNNYPTNLDSWLKCGPYNFSDAQRLMVRYQRWLDIPDLDGDFQFIGASTDGNYFNGVLWYGVQQTWVEQTAWLQGYEGQPQVWIALVFRSDNDGATGKGAWIDDFKIWRYNNPAITCGNSDYAPLLNDTYNSIKTAHPNAKVLFGGLGSAWNDSNDYFDEVYDRLNREQGGARPFDYFAIHPYFNDTYGLDPQVYMHIAAQMRPGDQTILDKFVGTMQKYNDPNKRMWITEVGWNSAVGAPGLGCLTTVVVTEQQQADYLKKGFDILFNEAPRVDKVIWYQYI